MAGVRFAAGRAAWAVRGSVAWSALAMPGVASAAGPAVFAGHTMDGGSLPCVTQSDGTRVCTGDSSTPGSPDLRFQSFDGTPLKVIVTLPAAPASGKDGDYPLIVENHGWGEPPTSNTDMQYGGGSAALWAKQGYAVVQFAARGWGDSCGTEQSRLVNPAACLQGYVHLADY